MIVNVPILKQSKASDILSFLGSEQRSELEKLAEQLRGKKVLHVNATAKGGGVAELLKSFIVYAQALAVDASWYAIDSKKAGRAFFDFTNGLHNALQGADLVFSKEEWKLYEKVSKAIAKDIEKIDYDILVAHDPQVLGVARFLKKRTPQMCVIHIDTSHPNVLAFKQVKEFVLQYDRVLFSNKDFVSGELPEEKIRIVVPAIDPLSPKQNIVPQQKAKKYLADYGIPQEGPLIVQVSRFDVWKNPHGLVEAFWLIQEKHPQTSLILVGFQEARDNPQAEKVFMDIRGMVGKDPRILLFFLPKSIGGIAQIAEFTTMAQNAADIVVQNSTREGFGLTIAEAMWKGKPVIGGPASGVRRQIQDGENGYIAQNTKQLAERLDFLLSHARDRKAIGSAGHASVRKYFLMPRLVLDHLKIYKEVL